MFLKFFPFCFFVIIKSLAGTECCGWEHHGGPNQQFRLEGQHLVCNLDGMELVLDIQGGSKSPGTKVILWTNEHTQKNQMWRLDYKCGWTTDVEAGLQM